MTLHRELPAVVSGYELSPWRGLFSVVLPIERTNLILNPSFETNTTGYTGVDGATITRTTETQQRGAFSARVKPGVSVVSGLYYTTSALVAGSTYAFSLDVNIRGGRKFQIRAFDGIRSVITKAIIGKGYWERVSFVFTAVTSGAHRIYLEKNGDANNVNTDNIFTDGWQLELCEAGNYWPTTYIDGDQSGFVINQNPPAYYWNGAAHASISTRSGQTRAGGREMNLINYGLRILGIVGLGMTPLVNVATPLSIGGALFQRTTQTAREFSLVGAIIEHNQSEIYRRRIELISAFASDVTGFQQPLLLHYQQTDDCGDAIGDILEIDCFYSGGLEGNTDNANQERVAIKFQMYDTSISAEGDNSKLLDFAKDINDSELGVVKYSNGEWSAVTINDYNGIINIIRVQGILYVLTGSGNVIRKIESDGSRTSISATAPVGGSISIIKASLDGTRIYIGGSFSSFAGVAAAGLMYYDIASGTFTAVSTSISAFGSVSELEFDDQGTLYVGGTFTTISGLTVTNIAKVSSVGVWSKLTAGAGANGAYVNNISFSNDGYLYVGGDFTTLDGVSFARIARFKISDSTWSALGSGLSGFPSGQNGIVIAKNGLIYVTGDFTTAGGIAVNYIAIWTGTTWSPIGNGLATLGQVYVDAIGNLYVIGQLFGSTRPSVLIWNGSTFIPLAIAPVPGLFPGSPTLIGVESMLIDSSSIEPYAGLSYGNYAIVGKNNTVNYLGKSRSYPTIIVTGSGELLQISNNTNSRFLIFTGLSLLPNEVLTIITKPGSISATSNFRGNMLKYISPASNLSDFYLQSGQNIVNAFMLSAGANASIKLLWKNNYTGIEGSIRR